MKVRPLYDRVLVRRLEEETKTASGLIIPDSAKEKSSRGEIVAVGSGKKNDDGSSVKMDVKVGDQVLFTEYAGHEIKVKGETMLIMREDDITAVIE